MELTPAESLLYSTVKLSSFAGGKGVSTGTGFFLNWEMEDGRYTILLVTNKHVLEGADQLVAMCSVNKSGKPSSEVIRCNVVLTENSLINHPSDKVDLCAVGFQDILEQAYQRGSPLFVAPLHRSLIPADPDWEYFDAIEDVLMVGCPRGIYDEVNNLPIVRRGITASPVSKMYNGKPEFMVDMACFPGSSGSPIFIYNQSGYYDRKEKSFVLGGGRLILAGILYAGPMIDNKGHIILGQRPEVAVQSMMHLGNAIRSSALNDIGRELERRVLGMSPGRNLTPS